MKNIVEIFKEDIKEIFKKANTWIIIIGLIILPSMYAWPNILSSWDPYGHTNEIKVAVTSLDKGASVEGKDVNIGKNLIDSLKDNKNLNWQFIDNKEQALEGVKIGDYYASIVIPENFSEDMTSITSGNLKKAQIEYTVNEKINAISPKITNSGASAIANNISKSFVEVANGVIFEKLHEAGIKFEDNLPTIKKIKEQINSLDNNFSNYEQQLADVIFKINNGQNILSQIQGSLPEIDKAATNSIMIAEKTGIAINNIENFNKKLIPSINEHVKNIEQVMDVTKNLAKDLQNKPSNKEQIKQDIELLNKRYEGAESRLEYIISIFNYFNNLSDNKVLENYLNDVTSIKNSVGELKNFNSTMLDNIDKYGEISEEIKKDFVNKTEKIDGNIKQFDSSLNNKVVPLMDEVLKKAEDKTEKVADFILSAQNELPSVENKISQTQVKINGVYSKLLTLQSELPSIKEKVKNLNQSIKNSENKVDENALFTLLQTNYKEQAQFFANPVHLQENKLFHIENYGSAMTPFYTTLSIWVGALLMSSLLTTKVEDKNNKYKPYEKYYGRGILFIIISLLQTLVITLGDMYLLGTQAASAFRFVAYGLLISLLFSIIVYTIVCIFGNVGKAICIIFLVLQIGSSGGTFPIQMTPKFFQGLYSKVPFSYAIGLLREAVGGVYMPAVNRDMKFLLIAMIVTLVIGTIIVTLKAKSKKLSAERERSKLFL